MPPNNRQRFGDPCAFSAVRRIDHMENAPPISCPYCNAHVPIPAGLKIGQRVPCLRCGESFLLRHAIEETGRPPVTAAGPIVPLQDEPVAAPPRWANRSIALTILAGMAGMAVLALVFALWTTDVRRGHDIMKPPRFEFVSVPLLLRFCLGPYLFVLAVVVARNWFQRPQAVGASVLRRYVLPTVFTGVGVVLLLLVLQPRRAAESESELIPVRVVPPTELAGLGYLPGDVNLVAGVHLAELLQSSGGQELLASLRLGPLDLSVDCAGEARPAKRDELDHVVLGVSATTSCRRPSRWSSARAALTRRAPCSPPSARADTPAWAATRSCTASTSSWAAWITR